MNIYQGWNFKDNPFNTNSLTGDELGNELIVGREEEIEKFIRRLYNMPQIVTIEGDFGIGKTSLINVGIFRATLSYINERKKSPIINTPLFVVCNRAFQLRRDLQFIEFLDEVLIEVAQTIIMHKKNFKDLGVKIPKNVEDVDKWLNSPSSSSFQGTIGFSLAQIGVGKTVETNTTQGFRESGLLGVVSNWLKIMFPNPNSGGIVCVIDNLELLENSVEARKVLENIRDTLLTIPGIRWVFCGSLGIVTSILSSPRLEGILHDPIELNGIKSIYIKDLFYKRIEKFKFGHDYYLPITVGSVITLYEILKSNLRNTLKYANDYCLWIVDNSKRPDRKDEKEALFMKWLSEKSLKYKNEIEKQLTPKVFKLFTDAVIIGGSFALCDYALLEFQNQQALKTAVGELETCGLVVCVIDEDDSRRKSVQITHKGWFVSFALTIHGR